MEGVKGTERLHNCNQKNTFNVLWVSKDVYVYDPTSSLKVGLGRYPGHLVNFHYQKENLNVEKYFCDKLWVCFKLGKKKRKTVHKS